MASETPVGNGGSGHVYVYALHDFEAENPDEVSFQAGQAVLVVEKDDAYGDGWWQGTNNKGETGLFPFSYTTFDKELAHQAQVDALAALNGSGAVMGSTMADIDAALAHLSNEDVPGASQNGGTAQGISKPVDGLPKGRASFASDRSGDMSVGETEDGVDAEAEIASRQAARAALAINAQKAADAASADQRAAEERKRNEAARIFAEEEERQRQKLLAKEAERKRELEQGTLKADVKDDKVAPIAGVEMSDESDSEGSDAAGPTTTHAPLFGNLAPQQAPQETQRSLSPIASASGHGHNKALAGAAAAAGATAGAAGVALAHSQKNQQASLQSPISPTDRRPFDQGSASTATDAGAPSTTATNTAATSVAGGSETPKSASAAGPARFGHSLSPTNSQRDGGPGGDPHEWSVDQVVEWGRSKGWDEASVVSKFAEHEISGDVLMEMDVNILKEIEIIAFGKRFQVANAIKELKKQLDLPVSPAPASAQSATQPWGLASTPAMRTGSPAPPSSAGGHGGAVPPFSGTASAPPTAGGLFAGVPTQSTAFGPPQHSSSYDPASIGPALGSRASNDSNGVYPSGMPGAPPSSGKGSRGLGESTEQVDQQPDSPLAGLASDKGVDKKVKSPGPASPRKRETGSNGRESGAGERTSFFGFQNRNRKPPPRVVSGASAATSGSYEESSGAKGTLGRLGFSRLRERSHQPPEAAPSSDAIKGKISLPTSSPTYDAMGDTARRNRQSQQSASSGGYPNSAGPGGAFGHAKQASIGSAGPAAGDWYGPNRGSSNEPRSPGQASAPTEGPVMARIRPVDLEGWMKKKGERYNSWKPRYLALKGSDLVILRDPAAPKIKGYVSMKGYKVIADENTNPGKYGFKILHENEKPHYFSSDDPVVVREWMKALMKSTIGRDNTLPVISSYNNATISLKEAQRMNPPPRPPSPTSRARAQRATARANKDQLTAKDASVLMGLGQPANLRQG
ncbi:hypothetical protein IE81DRAFT_322899 [Ceraceosorus guamensis]|uniref:PH-domain-containing protein n=1 Tax=Ceraceosorus guamensis TaxID=1522189 RepID=A0A316W303_9BASI|nr:hypothetical protein IE81DRAFT_322899 [Ceraceosorus guamensis]PWN42971.1 hypothetical protein IE81DRAFT_322899 [Ceraceosorus guamensis]